jgi:hypothetical protein
VPITVRTGPMTVRMGPIPALVSIFWKEHSATLFMEFELGAYHITAIGVQ